MNGNNNGSATKNRSYRSMKLAPTTRAIRSALALSATMLALSGSGAALAGTCAVTGLHEVTCIGIFTDDVTNTVPAIELVPDLTLIVGGTVDTTVDPAAGSNGITSTWGGDATVITYADINTAGADGVHMYSDDTATVSNYGSINSYVTGSGQQGIDATAYYGVTITNGGDITAATAASGTYDATAITGLSLDGSVTVENLEDASVVADSYGGTGTGISIAAYYDATVINAGSVYAAGNVATGVYAYAFDGYATVDNADTGSIDAEGVYGAIGVWAEGWYGASVDNAGEIYAYAGGNAVLGNSFYIAGVVDQAYYGDADFSNSGTVEAVAYGYTTGGRIVADGVFVYAYGNASVVNSGDITADASGYAFYGTSATGVVANSNYGDASVDNSGSITATAYGYGYISGVDATGVSVYSINGNAIVTNSGDVTATASNDPDYGPATLSYGAGATGISAISYNGDVSVDNSGNVTASASDSYYSYFGNSAMGIYGYSYVGDVTLDNSGTVTATASSYYGVNGNTATGMYAYSYNGDANLINSGTIEASTTGYSVYNGQAVGIDGNSYNGNVNVDNGGAITVSAEYGSALGVLAYSYNGNATVYTDGSIDVSAYGTAMGVYAHSKYGEVGIANGGDIDVSSSALGGNATGIYAYSKYGDSITIDNSGDVTATAGYGYANGIVAANYYGGSIDIANSGTVTATGYYSATGISANSKYSLYGDIVIDNSGTIDAYSIERAVGINASTKYGNYGSITIDNSGDITATAPGAYYVDAYGVSVYGVAVGIIVQGYYDVDITNSGNIDATAFVLADGIYARTYYGDLDIDNSGSITADAGNSYYFAAYATGIYAYNLYGDIAVTNSGDIDVSAHSGYGTGAGEYSLLGRSEAIGIYANNALYGDVTVINSGSISATATSYGIYYGPTAYGVEAYAKYGDLVISNSGDITATAHAGFLEYLGNASAIGIGAVQVGYYSDPSSSFLVENSGTITADASAYYGGATATGIYAETVFSDLYVDNSGSISAFATSGDYSAYSIAEATGIAAINLSPYYYYGNVSVNNSGTVDAVANGGYSTYYSSALAIGITAEATEGSVTVNNSGDVNATASAGAGSDYAFDNQADAYGIVAYNYDGNIWVGNYGDVTASASSGGYYGYANATGISALIGVDGYGSINVYNGGSVGAYAEDNAAGIVAQSYGSYFGGVVSVYNNGSIVAEAIGGDYATATGVEIDAYYAVFHNGGDGSIEATAESGYDYGSATATGVDISATYVGTFAYSDDAEAYVFYSGFVNEGSISAYAAGYVATATGVNIDSYAALLAYNYGDISAEARGYDAHAVGFAGSSYDGGVVLVNGGDIYATGDYVATGVWLDSTSYVDIYNFGTIEASGALYNYAIDTSPGGVADYIYNQGTITGAILTGAGDDFLYNGEDGVWNATGRSDFGDGDDTIVNYGLIAMTDAVIDLGYSDVAGNFFYNYGVVSADGTNYIYMGEGPLGGGSLAPTLVPSLNPNAFYNGGTIDFVDGDTDDMLTIVGDFAGYGEVNVDVSGLTGDSDILYIDGSVVDGSVNTINVNLLDLPESIETLIPMVYVSGDSVAANFELGDVTWDEDNSFVTLDFGLVADIDATNAEPDVFSLGIEVTGLSDVGTLAAAIPSAAVGLINTQVGTWRQRMGVIDSFSKGAIALWARVFQDKGSFSPEHHGDFSLGGNFDWEQKNSGAEAGVDFSVTDEFSIGLLVSKSKADIDLDDPGVGHADLDADTWGVYGTWISPNGFYLDASYRWTSFDVDTSSVAGALETQGDAETFNVEVGYAWTLSGGLKIEPQLQYTKTTIDNVDALVTSSGMVFAYDDADSSRGRLGVAIRKSFGDADTGWLWTPYATLSAVREFDGEALYSVNGVFHGESDLEGTSALLELGFTARHQNWAVYGGLNWQDGGAVNSFFGGQLGVRYTFGGPAPAPAPVVVPPAKTCVDLDDDGDGVNNCDDKCLGSTAGQAVGTDGCPVPEPVVEPKPFRG